MMKPCQLVLGSASPRRAVILGELGVRFDVLVPAVEETDSHGSPRATVIENAQRKLTWCVARKPNYRVLVADTVVEFDGKPVGKPGSLEEAADMFRRFSGRKQRVFTAMIYRGLHIGERLEVVESGVWFKQLTEETIQAYFSKVNPLDKAGGYDVDQEGDLIIDRWDGSYTNIMGLPAECLRKLLIEDGVFVSRHL